MRKEDFLFCRNIFLSVSPERGYFFVKTCISSVFSKRLAAVYLPSANQVRKGRPKGVPPAGSVRVRFWKPTGLPFIAEPIRFANPDGLGYAQHPNCCAAKVTTNVGGRVFDALIHPYLSSPSPLRPSYFQNSLGAGKTHPIIYDTASSFDTAARR